MLPDCGNSQIGLLKMTVWWPTGEDGWEGGGGRPVGQPQTSRHDPRNKPAQVKTG